MTAGDKINLKTYLLIKGDNKTINQTFSASK